MVERRSRKTQSPLSCPTPRVCAGTSASSWLGAIVAKTCGLAVGVGADVAAGAWLMEALGGGNTLKVGDGALPVAEAVGVTEVCPGRHPVTTKATKTASAFLASATEARGRVMRMSTSVDARIGPVDERAEKLMSTWLDGLSVEGRRTLYSLLDELCSGLDVSRHNPFGFLRLRAEFETSGELFGCSLPELRDAVAASLGTHIPPDRPRSALESLRDEISSRGHPDFR